MGCSGVNTIDEATGKEIQKIMEANYKELDILRMKNTFLELNQLNSGIQIGNIEGDFEDFALYQNEFDNMYNIKDSKINQGITNIIFEIKGKPYSIITPKNAGLRDVYYFFLKKINNPSYKNIKNKHFYYNGKDLVNNLINNDTINSIFGNNAINPKIQIIQIKG